MSSSGDIGTAVGGGIDASASLLALERVGRRRRLERGGAVALEDVTLAVAPGELVAIWGVPRSGRTTLLRVAAGLETPDTGVVRFDGRDLAAEPRLGRAGGIGFAQVDLAAAGGDRILDCVAMPLLAQGCAPGSAYVRAMEQLEFADAGACAELRASDLDAAERVRVAIGQALAAAPRLLLIDDPTRDVDLLEREGILALLREVADSGVAVLMTTGEAIGLSGVDRALTIGEGRLRAEVVAELAPVVQLPMRDAGSGVSARA